jgi:hypothetical protein
MVRRSFRTSSATAIWGVLALTVAVAIATTAPPAFAEDAATAEGLPNTSASSAPSEAAPRPGDDAPAAAEAAAAGPPRAVAPPDVPTLTVTPQPQLPGWMRSLSIGGGAILWYYAPVDLGAKQNVDLFFANLLLDGKFGRVGLHIEPRFRDSRLRDFYPGPVWAQEAYASIQVTNNTVVKAGKEYSRFGLFWDNSFYGNVQVYDGLKLDPDYGLSLEGAIAPDRDEGLRYYAQYFVVDGHTNVSLDGRDTISIPGANRRNQSIVRVEPFIKPNEETVVTGGVSGEFLQAALPSVTKNVFRAAVDGTVGIKRWSLWAEYTYQNGQTVTDFPIVARHRYFRGGRRSRVVS